MKPKMTLKRFKEIANETLERASVEYWKEEDVRSYMERLVDKAARNVIMTALGLREGWNHEVELVWNGSFLAILRNMDEYKVKLKAKEVLDKLLETYTIKLTPKEEAHLRKVYRECYKNCLEEKVRELAEETARVDAEEYFKKFMEEGEE